MSFNLTRCKNCGGINLDLYSIDYIEDYIDLKGDTETVKIWNYVCTDCRTWNHHYERGV